jgi:hypothetical protein
MNIMSTSATFAWLANRSSRNVGKRERRLVRKGDSNPNDLAIASPSSLKR